MLLVYLGVPPKDILNGLFLTTKKTTRNTTNLDLMRQPTPIRKLDAHGLGGDFKKTTTHKTGRPVDRCSLIIYIHTHTYTQV